MPKLDTGGTDIQEAIALLIGEDGLLALASNLLEAVTILPPSAPTLIESAAGVIDLDFLGIIEARTVADEDMTDVSFSNIVNYSTVTWIVEFGATPYDITMPTGTLIGGNGGALVYQGMANTTVYILIRNDNGTYHATFGDEHVVGS